MLQLATLATFTVAILVALQQTTAIPVFNGINDQDINGNACPLSTQYNVSCPLLCVKDAKLCPSSLAPTCGAGLTFCGDGTCQKSCVGILNACLCGGDATAAGGNYVPCAAGQIVDIPNYKSSIKDQQTAATCTTNAKLLTGAVGAWGSGNSSVWLVCPLPPNPFFTFTEPMWLIVWALSAAEAFILLSWHAYKTLREKKFRGIFKAALASGSNSTKAASTTAVDGGVETSEKTTDKGKQKEDPFVAIKKAKATDEVFSDGNSISESENLRFRGFNNEFYGTFAFISVILTTLGWLLFLAIIVADYYGSVNGTAYGIFLSSDLSSKIFCAVWHLSTAWLIAVNFSRHRMRNYFRIESFAHESKYVQIEKPQEQVIFLDDGGKLITRFQRVEAKLKKYFGADIIVSTARTNFTGRGRRYFEYQCMRYVFNEANGRFEPYEFDLGYEHKMLLKQAHGLSTEEAIYRQDLLGPNFIPVHVPNFFMALIQEFTAWFYVYQMMCLWVWYYFQYYYMGLVQTFVILVSALIKVLLRLRAEKRIKRMAEFQSMCRVLRDGEWKDNISTADLVPGDVFEVSDHSHVPCDAVVLSGNVVVDESNLTGEALPVRKFAIQDDDGVYDPEGSGKGNTLFAGTFVSQTALVTADASSTVDKVTAMAIATGTATDKGELIHKILFPNPISFIFNEHLKVVVVILLLWGFVAYCLSIYLIGRGDITSWFYGIFVISEIFSPLLPAALTVGQSVAANRLRGKNIYCIDLPRIIIAGKVRIFCFDKTGTLTKEGLEFYGGVATLLDKEHDRSQYEFMHLTEEPQELGPLLRMGIATCHAVTKVDDQFIGNPVDIESFRAMKWDLVPSANPLHLDTLIPAALSPAKSDSAPSHPPVHIVKRFEFVHARASQSVAVHDTATNHLHVFIKGSFERVKQISAADSLPANYDAVAAKYAQEGCYVLSIAHRDLGVVGTDVEIEQVKGWSREQLESHARFMGLVLFRNKLKEDTPAAIAELKGGDTRAVMITGDNALTGVYIARQCGMIGEGQRVVLGDLVAGEVAWRNVDNGDVVDVEEAIKDKKFKPVELAVTGKAFEVLVREEKMKELLLDTRIFARMTPNDKVKCVQLHMEKGITAMCGDGGNDCGALRAAHVGIALSEAEASIVSPFSTNVRSVQQCVELLRQGRAALATSFAGYKFLILYGETMAWFELLMFYFTVIASQPIWIMIDGFITVCMTFAITQSQPAKVLGPRRPTAKLLGPYTLFSTLGVIFINFWFVVCSIAWLFQQSWYLCNEFDGTAVDASKWWLIGDNYEAEIIALVVVFQFFNSAAIYNWGTIFRRAWWRNYLLVFFWTCCFISTSWLVLADPNPYSCIFRINCGTASVLEGLGYPKPWWYIEDYNSPLGHNVLPRDFRWRFWLYCTCNCLVTVLYERVLVLGFGRDWFVRRFSAKQQAKRVEMKL